MKILLIPIIIAIFGFPFFYFRWGEKVIRENKRNAAAKLDDLKSHIDSEIHSYSFYINNHPYFWGKSSYPEIEDTISNSSGWVVYPLFYPKRLIFDIKACNKTKRIFFANGKYNFDWDSLLVYEDTITKNT
jgi:hypothetical protein